MRPVLRWRILVPIFFSIILLGITFNLQKVFSLLSLGNGYGQITGIQAYDFDLVNEKGHRVRLHDYHSTPVYLFFGFTKCQGVCPINMQIFLQLAQALNKDTKQAEFLFISIDPIRDNTVALNEFVLNYSGYIHALGTGVDTTQKVANEFKNYYSYEKDKIKDDKNHQIQHNGFIYLIGKNDQLITVYPQRQLDVERLKQDFLALDRE